MLRATFIEQHGALLLLAVGTTLLVGGLSSLSNAQVGVGNPMKYNDVLVGKAWCTLYWMMERAFGALIATIAGIVGIISAAFGAYRAAIALVATSVGAFILRAVVSLFFGTPTCDFLPGYNDGGSSSVGAGIPGVNALTPISPENSPH